MARVLLIQPPLMKAELFVRGSRTSASLIPPLSLAYIASYLCKYGHECHIIDGVAQPLSFSKICEIAQCYDVIGVTVVSTYAVRAIQLIQALKRAGISQPLVVGGPHVTALPRSLLIRGADYAVVGEGEVTMLQLVEALEAGSRDLSSVEGLVFVRENEFVHTGRRRPIDPLDQVPLPARHLLPMSLYRSSVARSTRQPSHSMVVSRGCPGICTFCSKKTFGTKIRYFGVERIVEEFFLLRDKYGARDVAVWDDNFVSDAAVVLGVCEELRRRNFNTSWSLEARIDHMTPEILRFLRNAGCTYIAYGIESGSQRVLNHIKKRTTKEKIIDVVRMTREIGIATRGYFMLGLTSETREEMEETIRFAIELDIEVASFTLFVPLPGTVEYYRCLKSGTFPDAEYFHHTIIPEFNFLDQPVYVPEGMTSDELLSIHRSAYSRYYFRPRVLFRKFFSVSSPGQLLDLMNGGVTLMRNAIHRKQ